MARTRELNITNFSIKIVRQAIKPKESRDKRGTGVLADAVLSEADPRTQDKGPDRSNSIGRAPENSISRRNRQRAESGLLKGKDFITGKGSFAAGIGLALARRS